MEVRQADFARMAGVSAVAINKKVRNGTLILNSAGFLDTDNPMNRVYLDAHRVRLREKLALEDVARSARGSVPPVLGDPASGVVPAYGDVARSARGGVTPATTGGAGAVVGEGSHERTPHRRRPQKASRSEMSRAWSELNGAYASACRQDATVHDYLSMPVGELVRRHGTVEGVEKYVRILRDLTTADEREQRTQERRATLIPREFVTQRIFGYLGQLSNKLLDIPESVCDQLVAVVRSGEDPRSRVIAVLGDNISRAIAGAKEQVASELSAYKGGPESLMDELAEKIERLGEKSE